MGRVNLHTSTTKNHDAYCVSITTWKQNILGRKQSTRLNHNTPPDQVNYSSLTQLIFRNKILAGTMKCRVLLSFLIGLLTFNTGFAQKHEWANKIRSTPTTSNTLLTTRALATSDSGFVYVGGGFRDSLFIENDTHYFQSTGSSTAIFIAKFREDGSLVWSKSITSASSAQLKDIKINSNGSILLFGDYSGASSSISFGSYSLSRSRGIFLAFMNPNGGFTNAIDLAYASGWTGAIDIELGPNDEIYSYLYLNGFGSGYTINSTTSPVNGSGFAYIFCKHDSTGQRLIWNNTYDISDHIEIGAMGVESNGNLVYSFRAGTNRTIHGVSTGSNTPLMLIRAASSNGNIAKTSKVNTSTRGAIQSIACPKPNQIFIQGYAQNDSIELGGIIAKSVNQLGRVRPYYFQALLYDLDTAVWAQASTASSAIFVGASDMVYSGGFLYSGFAVDADSFVLGGLREFKSTAIRIQSVIAKFDTLGNALWILKTPSSQPPLLEPIDRNNIVYYGSFKDSVVLPPFTLNKSGTNSWAFLAKTFDFTIERGEVSSGPYCAGDSLRIPYTKTGDYDTSNFFVAEISDQDGKFNGGERELGRIKSNQDSVILGELPLLKVPTSDKYRIRIRSTAPAVQSFFREDTLNLLIYSRDKADPGSDTSICLGDTLELNTFGGTTWTWSPAKSMDDSTLRTPKVWPSSATTYQIIIGDSSGCGAPDTASIKVSILDPPHIDTSFQSDTFVCLNQTVTIKAAFERGTGDYTALWLDTLGQTLRVGQTTSLDSFQFQFQSDTTIILILTDSCSIVKDTAIYRVFLNPDRPQKPVLVDTTLCFGQELGIQFPSAFEPTDSQSISWYVNGVFRTDEFDWSDPWATSSVVRYELSNRCVDTTLTDSFEIVVNAEPTVRIDNRFPKTAYCTADSILLAAQPLGGNGNQFYRWIVGDSVLSTDSFLRLPVIQIPGLNFNTNDSVTIRLTYTDSCSNTIGLDSFKLRTLEQLVISDWMLNDSIYCRGDSINLKTTREGGLPQVTFSWLVDDNLVSNDSLFTFVPSAFSPNTVNVKLVVDDQCSYPDSIQKSISIPDSLESTITSVDDTIIVCNNERLMLNSIVRGGRAEFYTFTWMKNGGFASDTSSFTSIFSTDTASREQVRLVKLSITDNCSDYTSVDSVFVRLAGQVIISLSNDSVNPNQSLDTTLCYGQDMRLEAQLFNAHNPSQRVEWHVNNTLVSDGLRFNFGPLWYQSNISNYRLHAIVFDSCSGLSDTANVTIQVRDSLQLSPLTDTLICYGSNLRIEASATGGLANSYSWNWSDVISGNNIGTTSVLALSDVKTSSTIRLELIDNCSVNTPSRTMVIDVLPQLQINPSPHDVCFEDSIRIAIQGNGGIAATHRYTWFVNDNLQQDTLPEIVIRGDSIYTYTVILTDGCSNPADTLSRTVASNPQLIMDLPPDTVCEIFTHQLNVEDATNISSTLELFQNQLLQTDINRLNLSRGNYQFEVMASNTMGCRDSVEFDVFVKPRPNPHFTSDPSEPSDDNPIVSFNSQEPADSIFWRINNVPFGNSNTASFEFKDTGLYDVSITIYRNGCKADSSVQIPFTRNFKYFGVTAFSPNTDGINDTYKPVFTGFLDFTYSIYNRWGELIFRGDNNSEGWDGSFNGRTVTSGQYLVLIEARDTEKRPHYKSHLITVVE